MLLSHAALPSVAGAGRGSWDEAEREESAIEVWVGVNGTDVGGRKVMSIADINIKCGSSRIKRGW